MKSKASKNAISKSKSKAKIFKKKGLKKKELKPILDESEEELSEKEFGGTDEGDYKDTDQVEEEEEAEESEAEEESESEEDGDEEMDGVDPTATSGKVTMTMINKWERDLENKGTIVPTFKRVQQALSAAVDSIKGSEEKGSTSPYIVKGPQMFNAVVRLCLRKVAPALQELFQLETLSDRPKKNKKWPKLVINIKKYLRDLILLIKSISEPSAIEAILKKGVLSLLPFYSEFPKISWYLMRHLSALWGTSHEKVRVLALISIFRLVKAYNDEKRDKAFKLLYISYVNNCRFTSPSSWPLIDFMRMSLVELYALDLPLAYRHAFIYIRQLAFHLRNAMLVQKKERLQLVYNWQYVHCLHFWSDLLAATHTSPVMQPLIYPIVQVAQGVLTLLPTSKYFPLTFHVCNILSDLSFKTDTFIPVLPYLLEMLHCQKLRAKPKKSSLKPYQWDCIIKLSKSQLEESAFTDGLIEQIFDCSINYLNTQCSSIGFPELVLPMTTQLKSFLKKCRVPAHTRKLKQLLDKTKDNSDFISDRRKAVTFGITDAKAIKNWQIATEQAPPPLRTFCLQWKSLKAKLRKSETPSEEERDLFSISAVRRRQRDGGMVGADSEEEEEELKKEEKEEEVEELTPPSKKAKVERRGSPDDAKKKPLKVKHEEEGDDEEDDDFEGDVVRQMDLSDYEDSHDD